MNYWGQYNPNAGFTGQGYGLGMGEGGGHLAQWPTFGGGAQGVQMHPVQTGGNFPPMQQPYPMQGGNLPPQQMPRGPLMSGNDPAQRGGYDGSGINPGGMYTGGSMPPQAQQRAGRNEWANVQPDHPMMANRWLVR